jgi:hypothetical protein
MIAQNDLEKVRHQKAARTVLRDPVDRTEGCVMDGATRGLQSQPAQTQAGRGGLRLGQDHRRDGEGESARLGARELQVHVHDGRLQSDPHA